MSLEEALIALLNPIFPGNRIWWNVPPDAFDRAEAFCALQRVGGEETWYVEKDTAPSHENARVQIEIYHADILVVAAKMRAVSDALRESAWATQPFGAPVDDYNDTLKLAIRRQDFGIWRAFDP
jgi:hypothetical protein